MHKLSDKQRIFAREYMVDLNAMQAAVRAGYAPGSVQKNAWRLLKNPAVAKEIGRLMEQKVQKIEMTEEEILRELTAVARANASDFAVVEARETLDRAGNPCMIREVEVRPTGEILPDRLPALAGIKQSTHGVELKLYDKLRAIELLMRFRGMLKDKGAGGGEIVYPEELEGSEY